MCTHVDATSDSSLYVCLCGHSHLVLCAGCLLTSKLCKRCLMPWLANACDEYSQEANMHGFACSQQRSILSTSALSSGRLNLLKEFARPFTPEDAAVIVCTPCRAVHGKHEVYSLQRLACGIGCIISERGGTLHVEDNGSFRTKPGKLERLR